jgi:arylsulfatase A-like enzyme
MKKYFCFGLFVLSCFHAHSNSNQPKLIVQLIVDQLRGDLIQKHQPQFTDAGFNYLLNHAINYSNAHHPHANTTTCAGHATIATGSYPSLHGIINNDWYDRKSKQMIYCMEDLHVHVLPTQHTKINLAGRSPKNLYSSTLSDEILLANKGRAFGVAFKDRSAIALAGHAGKAFWFDTTNGGFVTSSYYYKTYPLWVQKWNLSYTSPDFDWELGNPQKQYQNKNSPTFLQIDTAFGQTFPHHIKTSPDQDYYKSLSKTPKADQITANFAELLLAEEGLGLMPNKTDYLAISFSGVDAIGHQFGPNSLEAEDNLLELDKTLAHLFDVINKQVGLNNVLIVLSADHGVNDGPAYLKSHHIAEIPPINIPDLERFIQATLKKRYNLPEQTLTSIIPPYIYLDHKIIHQHKLNLREIGHYLAQKLTLTPGIFKAFTLPVTQIEKDWLSAKVNRMYYPYRAGDIYIVQPPNQSNGAKNIQRITHGSPWNYDSYVPLLFVNPGFKAQKIVRQVYTTDIATTLSTLLMIKPPSASVGQPLEEVLNASEELAHQ